jgi:hypothetical protein
MAQSGDMIIEGGQEFTIHYNSQEDVTYLLLNGSVCIALMGNMDKPITALWRTWGYKVRRYWQQTYFPEAAARREQVQAAFAARHDGMTFHQFMEVNCLERLYKLGAPTAPAETEANNG